MDSDHTGIESVNRITESDRMNVMSFEYLYNGAGVGIADLNNDGKQDIIFTGNQVATRAYLNEGNLKSEQRSKLVESINIAKHITCQQQN